MRSASKTRRQVLIAGIGGVGNRIGHRRQRSLKQFSNLVICGFFWKNFVTGENPSRVGVHDKYRMVSGIEQYGIGGLRAHSMEVEEFFAKMIRGLREQFRQRALVLLIEKLNKKFQPLGLLTEITSGTNQALEFG
jgi:hypothetical protein